MQPELKFFPANNGNYRYTGRIDFSNPALPRFWLPGVYITAKFAGRSCEIHLNDEEYGRYNYVSIAIDDQPAMRMELTGRSNVILIDTLNTGIHQLVICKSTESNIGYVEFAGLKCKNLLPPDPMPVRRIEFIGNSITCGTGSDPADIGCGKGKWHDQHNAYLSYGPLTARALNARWVLSAYSGIGMIRSCCGMKITMPDVIDKVNMRDNEIPWDFSKYRPDVVTICLGQNDGIQDSVKFCSAYVDFIERLRGVYPKADIICLSSPMADQRLAACMKNYITGIVAHIRNAGDTKVHSFFFLKRYNHGCDDHPNLEEHEEIAAELTSCIRNITGW